MKNPFNGSFRESPDEFCPRCGCSEAMHPEACDITPKEWRAAKAALRRELSAQPRPQKR